LFIGKGLYKPKGLLQLPFVVENTEYGHQLYSFFDKRFITGEGVLIQKILPAVR
jgi:hypothetical protein